jgi:hypothetical protein
MANRNQKLAFQVGAAPHTLRVTAPANTFVAPPTFYMLFLVANDDSYSTGRWLQLKQPFDVPPATLRTTATAAVPAASSRFEGTSPTSECLGAPAPCIGVMFPFNTVSCMGWQLPIFLSVYRLGRGGRAAKQTEAWPGGDALLCCCIPAEMSVRLAPQAAGVNNSDPWKLWHHEHTSPINALQADPYPSYTPIQIQLCPNGCRGACFHPSPARHCRSLECAEWLSRAERWHSSSGVWREWPDHHPQQQHHQCHHQIQQLHSGIRCVGAGGGEVSFVTWQTSRCNASTGSCTVGSKACATRHIGLNTYAPNVCLQCPAESQAVQAAAPMCVDQPATHDMLSGVALHVVASVHTMVSVPSWGLFAVIHSLNVLLVPCAAGARIHTHLWARTAASNAQVTTSLGRNDGRSTGASNWIAAVQLSGQVTADYQQFALVSGAPASCGMTRGVMEGWEGGRRVLH